MRGISSKLRPKIDSQKTMNEHIKAAVEAIVSSGYFIEHEPLLHQLFVEELLTGKLSVSEHFITGAGYIYDMFHRWLPTEGGIHNDTTKMFIRETYLATACKLKDYRIADRINSAKRFLETPADKRFVFNKW